MKGKFDVSKHILVPKHLKVSEKEKEELLKRYNISVNELPKISKNDHAIKGMGLKEGDVIKVIRKSQTAKEAIFYRGVIDG